MENITLDKTLDRFKPIIEKEIAELIYNGLWFSPLMKSLFAFLKVSQKDVSATVRVRLLKGNVIVKVVNHPIHSMTKIWLLIQMQIRLIRKLLRDLSNYTDCQVRLMPKSIKN